jgi:hypothetical protein
VFANTARFAFNAVNAALTNAAAMFAWNEWALAGIMKTTSKNLKEGMTMKHFGVSLSLFPTSWKIGKVRNKTGKGVYAFGPFRFTWHIVGG